MILFIFDSNFNIKLLKELKKIEIEKKATYDLKMKRFFIDFQKI